MASKKGAIMKLLFSLEAVSSILVECYKSSRNLETGGILVGPKKHRGIITDIIPSTIYAERATATYFQSPKDVKILNHKLKVFQLKGYDFKGYFHKHPTGLFNLSHGDNASCKEILQSPNYRINNFLVMCIVTESYTQDFPIFSYIANLTKKREVVVEKTSIHVLPKFCITECAECFESQITGENHENHNVKQDSRKIEKQESRTFRNSGKGLRDSKLIGIETRA
jgi:hypothetical protein